jgi:hypothetical protein
LKILRERNQILASAVFVEKRFFLMTCASAVNYPELGEKRSGIDTGTKVLVGESVVLGSYFNR